MERRGEGERNQDHNLCVGAVRQVNKRRSRVSINSSLSLSPLQAPPSPPSLSRTHSLCPSPSLRLSVVFVWFVNAQKIAQHVLPPCFQGMEHHKFRARPLAHFLGLM